MNVLAYSLLFLMSLLCVVILGYKIFRKLNLKVAKSWILMLLGFFFNMLYSASILRIHALSLPWSYPSYLDFFWIISNFLVGFGILMYWIELQEKKKGMAEKVLILFLFLIVSFTATAFLLETINLVEDLIIDVIYIACMVFALSACALLIKHFMGKTAPITWRLWFIGGLTFFMGSLFYYINQVYPISQAFEIIAYLLAYFFVLLGVIKISNNRN